MIDINATFDNTHNIINLLIKSDAALKYVSIDTQKTFNCGESSSIYAWKYEITPSTSSDIYYQEDDLYVFNYNVNLNDIVAVETRNALLNADVTKDMFFIYAMADGDFVETIALAFDEQYLRQYLFNRLYDSIDSKKCCEINNDIVDILLLYNAFKLSIINKDKVYFWNLLHMSNIDNNSNCSCNG